MNGADGVEILLLDDGMYGSYTGGALGVVG